MAGGFLSVHVEIVNQEDMHFPGSMHPDRQSHFNVRRSAGTGGNHAAGIVQAIVETFYDRID